MIYLQDSDFTLHLGDVLTVLREMPSDSVDCVITSPPYWGLRDYGTGAWAGGDAECDHVERLARNDPERPQREGWERKAPIATSTIQFRATCGKCGASRQDAQLGLEPTPEQYVERMTEVFREVRRVLAAHGTCWLNMGDSYSGSWSGHSMRPEGGQQRPGGPGFQPLDSRVPARVPNVPGLKQKDLCGIPWRLAFALQADGWYLRSDIVWSKPNPMPESVTDRPTKAHEYVFLLTKSPRYFFDQEAVREPMLPGSEGRYNYAFGGVKAEVLKAADENGIGVRTRTIGMREATAGRNIRSVWEIATQPYPEAHFATFPEELVRRCLLAGTSERGVCAECGAPWVRETSYSPDANRPQAKRALEIAEREGLTEEHISALRACGISDVGKALVTTHGTGNNNPAVQALADEARGKLGGYAREFLIRGRTETLGWRPSCKCHATWEKAPCLYPLPDGRRCCECSTCQPEYGVYGQGQPDPVPATVLDPFMGSGTTALVARKHGRQAVGIELNAEYCELIVKRTQQLSLLSV